MLNEVYNSESQSNGILSLIDKEKDLLKIKNWRLLMILCTYYNFLTKIQTIRINKYLPRVKDADQRSFMKDYYTGTNILELQHLIDFVNEKTIAGLLMCIAFEKAFVTIEWEFLFKNLEYFNLGEPPINLIKIFYNGCGQFLNSRKFARKHVKLYCGLKQGDVVDVYCSTMWTEIL